MIVRCCYCESAALRITDARIELTQMSDIGGGDYVEITGHYPVYRCANCQSMQWLDVYGKTFPLGENPSLVDTADNLIDRGSHAVSTEG